MDFMNQFHIHYNNSPHKILITNKHKNISKFTLFMLNVFFFFITVYFNFFVNYNIHQHGKAEQGDLFDFRVL